MGRTEREIVDLIVSYQRIHQAELEPLFKELTVLRALQPPPPIVLPIADVPLWVLENLKRSEVTE